MPVPLIGTGRTLLSGGRLLAESATARAARYGLVAAWNGEDVSDSFGANTLTNNGVATFVAGKLGNAVNLVAASTQYLSIADNPALSMGAGVKPVGWAWVNMASKPATDMEIMSKWNGTGNQRGYLLEYSGSGSGDRFQILVSQTGAAVTATAVANTFGSPSTATWYLVFWYYDGVNLGISINGGAFDTVAFSADIFNETQEFAIGRAGFGGYWNGQIDAIGLAKNPTATVTEMRDYIWNGGVGRQYPLGWAA